MTPPAFKMQSTWASSTTYVGAYSGGSVSQNLHQYGDVSSDWQKKPQISGYSFCTRELCINISLIAQKLHM